MKRIVCLLICVCGYFQLFSQGVDFKQITLKEALEQVKAQGKMVFVDCYTTWCGPCKVLSPTVEALGKELAGQVRVLKIDVDKNEALATQLRIQSVPTLIIFKKGEIVWRSSGVMDHGSLLRKAQSYID